MTRLPSHPLRLAAAAGLAIWLGGCANLGYYVQAVSGQMDILRRGRPIEEITADPQADQALKRRLVGVARLREFASRELKLPDNHSYASYADLERPYVVWKVVLHRGWLRQLPRLFLERGSRALCRTARQRG
jgi:predicted aminopeptidase